MTKKEGRPRARAPALPRASALALSFVGAALLLLPPGARGIENKCGACMAMQTELMAILQEERPSLSLDMRNRLNSQGKREGKIIDYKMSELRIIEILEGLCEKLKKYALMNAGNKKRIWMHGQPHPTDRLRLIAEEQGKELKRWCDRMVEKHEDDMAVLIREGEGEQHQGLPLRLCHNVTGNCKDEGAFVAETQRMDPFWPNKKGEKGTPKEDASEAGGEKGEDADSQGKAGAEGHAAATDVKIEL